MKTDQVHFVGPEHQLRVSWYRENFTVRPVIATKEVGLIGMALGIPKSDLEEGTVYDYQFTDMSVPIDIFAAWRACQAIGRMRAISTLQLKSLGYAFATHRGEYTIQFINNLVPQITPRDHREIMDMPIPLSIIKLFIELQDRGVFMDLEALNDLLLEGKVEWRPIYGRYGLRPSAFMAERAERESTALKPYNKYLVTWMVNHGISTISLQASEIERYIIEGIERGLQQRDLVMARAIALALPVVTEGDLAENIQYAAAWCHRNFRKWRWAWPLRGPIRSQEEYEATIRSLISPNTTLT